MYLQTLNIACQIDPKDNKRVLKYALYIANNEHYKNYAVYTHLLKWDKPLKCSYDKWHETTSTVQDISKVKQKHIIPPVSDALQQQTV